MLVSQTKCTQQVKNAPKIFTVNRNPALAVLSSDAVPKGGPFVSQKGLSNTSTMKSKVPAKVKRTVTLAMVAAVDATDNCVGAHLRDKIETEVRVMLSQVTGGSQTSTLGQSLNRLDAIIEETVACVNKLRRGLMSVFLKARDPNIVELPQYTCINLHSMWEAKGYTLLVPPDFARLVQENHALAAIANSAPEPLFAVHHDSLKHSTPPFVPEGPSNVLYQAPQRSPLGNGSKSQDAILEPALRAFVGRQIRDLSSFWSDQAADYDDAETCWSEAVCIWEHQKNRSSQPKVRRSLSTAATSVVRNYDMAPATENVSVASGTSLFSLDQSHSKVGSRTPTTSRYAPTPIEGDKSGGTGAPTRARKALRDETTEHERLVSEVLASSAKEARFERGAVDDKDLPVPLPISVLAQEDARLRESLLSCRVVLDPFEEETCFSKCRQWSDLEKCIFLDKFLQYPKNFRKISAFISRKRARDCARLYYDSKYSVDYKALLREHQQRRRGVRVCWDVTAKAVQTFGGELDHYPLSNVISFRLPVDNFSRTTVHKCPLINRGANKNLALTCVNELYPHLPLNNNSSRGNVTENKANGVTKHQRRPTRKQSNTKSRSLANQPPHAAKDTNRIAIGGTLGEHEVLAGFTANKRIGDKHELGLWASRNYNVTQKRVKQRQSNQPAPQIYVSPGSVTAIQAPHQYAPPIGAFGSHDGGCNFLSHPPSVSPGLSTSALSLCGQQPQRLNNRRRQEQHNRHQHHHQHHQQAHECQLNIIQIQGNPASLLRAYSLPPAISQPRDKQRRLTYDQSGQTAPMLPIFSDNQQLSYQPQTTNFHGGTPGPDLAQHAADAAYIAALGAEVDAHGNVSGSSGVPCGGDFGSDGTSSYVGHPNCFLSDLRKRCLGSLSTPNGRQGQFFVGMDGQEFGSSPIASKALCISDSRSPITNAKTLLTDACDIPHKNPPFALSSIPLGAASHTASGTHDVQRTSTLKWTASERSFFLRYLTTRRKNCTVLAHLLSSKTETQIKGYYQNYKNRLGLQDFLSSWDTGSKKHRPGQASRVACVSNSTRSQPAEWAPQYHPSQFPKVTKSIPALQKVITNCEVNSSEPLRRVAAVTEYGNMPQMPPSTVGSFDGLHGLIDCRKDTLALIGAAAPEANAHVITEDNAGSFHQLHFLQSSLLSTHPSPLSWYLTTPRATNVLELHTSQEQHPSGTKAPQIDDQLASLSGKRAHNLQFSNKHAGCSAKNMRQMSRCRLASDCMEVPLGECCQVARRLRPEWWPQAAG